MLTSPVIFTSVFKLIPSSEVVVEITVVVSVTVDSSSSSIGFLIGVH